MRKLARSRRSEFFTADERETIAWLGALKAVKSYDPARGTKLSSWICTKAGHELQTAERRERIARARCSYVSTARLAEIIDNRAETGGETAFKGGNAQLRATIENALETLETREQTILRLAMFEKLPQREIGERLGLSQSMCSRLYREGLARLRERIRALLKD